MEPCYFCSALDLSPSRRAHAPTTCCALGDHAFNADDFDAAESLYRQALAAASARGDSLASAELINDLAAVQQVRGNGGEMARLKTEADRQIRATGPA